MAVLLASLASILAALSTTSAAVETTLCAVVARPEAFNGKLVRFRAGVLTDWQHATVLVHSGCERGIELSSTNAVPTDESQAFDEAVGNPFDGGRDRTAMATFTGRFSLPPGQPEGAFDNSFKFSAERIQRVQV